MFRALKSSKLPEKDIFAVTVGASSKQTLASYHVLESEDVVGAMEALNNARLGAGAATGAAKSGAGSGSGMPTALPGADGLVASSGGVAGVTGSGGGAAGGP